MEHPKKPVPGRDFDPRRSNLEKDPDDWVSGDDPMTDAQSSYLATLCEQAHEEFEPHLTKAEASKRIDALRAKLGLPDHHRHDTH
ncbi:DUF3072 domain-containing protein [Sandaracinus amylolyticus]|uniref:DUF3072 domain-containing protein n=1 Tax=Sandaracinus amylolyticus TaxID=927083 RepID=A0A0F6WAN6_9BACT|nr:DUF3072 domain-containing protein [Sandaracinus amylolyticus]AKF11680.1 hypothetical protein DB32_008829 [Sandaracinus amylolyticus]